MIAGPTTPADVLVVGAGPTGLAMALELVRLGVRCRIIDKAPQPSRYSKALGVQARTLEYFERIGTADAAVAAGHKVYGLSAYSDRRRIIHLNFDQIESRYNYVLVLPQSETERLLGERLASLGVAVERNVELVGLTQDDTGIDAIVRSAGGGSEERVRVRWLIGCDGPHSAVRHLLGISFEGKAFHEVFALADVRLDAHLPEDEIAVYLAHGDLVGLFPLTADGRFRIVIERHEEPAADREPALNEFQMALDTYGPRGARVSDPVWLSRFHISQRQVAHYRQGRAFLAGDAAHIHSPLGAQGMNTGIQDACNLAWKLALVNAGRARPELLDSYEQERQPVGKTLLRATGAMSRVILWRNRAAEAVRDRILSLLTSFDLVQDRIRKALSELGVSYRHSPIVREDREPGLAGFLANWFHAEASPRAGDRAPDGVVHRGDGNREVRLFELLGEPYHTLLLFAGQRTGEMDLRRRAQVLEAVAGSWGDLLKAYIVRYIARPEGSGSPPDLLNAEVLLDPGGVVHRVYGAAEETLFLIRPDGYVGYRSQPIDLKKLIAYLNHLLVWERLTPPPAGAAPPETVPR
jgi:2-polyprenyl-6-methoxyphenol hydroxylase-like FAD-dependent oxidoreductase